MGIEPNFLHKNWKFWFSKCSEKSGIFHILEFCTERSQIQPEPLLVAPNAKFYGLPDAANDFGALRGTNHYFSHFVVKNGLFWGTFFNGRKKSKFLWNSMWFFALDQLEFSLCGSFKSTVIKCLDTRGKNYIFLKNPY